MGRSRKDPHSPTEEISAVRRGSGEKNVSDNSKCIGSFQKTSIPPHGGNWKLTPLPPSDVLNANTFTIIRNNFFSPPPLDGRNFLRGGSVDLFWNDPLGHPKGVGGLTSNFLCGGGMDVCGMTQCNCEAAPYS